MMSLPVSGPMVHPGGGPSLGGGGVLHPGGVWSIRWSVLRGCGPSWGGGLSHGISRKLRVWSVLEVCVKADP